MRFMPALRSSGGRVNGTVAAGFEGIERVFRENIATRGELGASVVVMHRGRVVVDLWGGVADVDTGRAWAADTPAVCFSATKGLVATCFLVLEDRGALDLDAPIAQVWPEFAQNGKARITTRHLLGHRAGLWGVDVPLSLRDVRDDPAKVHDALARQRPAHEPGADQGYAACAFGLYTAELFRRVTGRTLGAFFAEEVAGPLRLDVALGRPTDLAQAARLVPTGRRTLLRHQLPAVLSRGSTDGRLFRRVLLGTRSDAGQALLNPTLGPARFRSLDEPDLQAIELPWMNALATARGLARLYAALAGDGSLDGVRLVRPESLRPLYGRQSWSERDRVLQKPIGWSQGFVKDEPHLFTPSPRAFGHPGAGGALGWADPDRELAIGYVMNAMDWRLRSPRATALADAAWRAVDRLG